MIVYSIIVLTFALLYVNLILFILTYWNYKPPYLSELPSKKTFKLSIIIPVRNEEKMIEQCISSLLNNNSLIRLDPEIIVVDDHSCDNTVKIIESIQSPYVVLLNLADYLGNKRVNAYKKAAINYALSKATGDIIIQLDGDITVGEHYLQTIHDFFVRNNPDFVTAPVLINSDDVFSEFQSLDMIGMMAVTKAGIESNKWYMANGANMAYKNKLIHFDESSPASGDDIFGIQQVASNPDSNIRFLKESSAIVTTEAELSVGSFYKQRIRWATKNKTLKGGPMKLLMMIPYVNSLLLMLHIIMSILVGPVFLILFSIHFLIKVSIDYIYLKEVSDFFLHSKKMRLFVFKNIIHILYLTIVGTMSLFVKKYNWKERSVH